MNTWAELFEASEESPWLSMARKITFLLAKLRPDQALSYVLRDLKANATGWLHEVFPSVRNFSWQRGYGAFTVSQSNARAVGQYIELQKEHHKKVSFREEFIEFMRANGIEYNEKFV
jgi:putative transposase